MAAIKDPIGNEAYYRNTIWDPSTRRVFVELCVDEIKNGNKPGTHLRWVNLRKNMKERVGMDFTREELKNQWFVMKRDLKLFDRLIRIESGLRWDPVRKTIDATPEWWDEKITADPKLAKFKGKNLEIYHQYYELLFWHCVAIGDNMKTPCLLLNNNIACDVEKDIGANKIEGKGDTDEVDVGDSTKKYFLESSSTKRKKEQLEHNRNRSTKGKSIGTSSFELKLDTVLQELSSQSAHNFPPSRKVLSIRECMEIVASFPGFEPSSDNYNKAIKIFFSKEAREGFMIPPTAKDKMSFLYSLFD